MSPKTLIPILAILAACQGGEKTEKTETPVPKATFNDTLYGKPTHLYELHNGKLSAKITDYGARLVSLTVPDRKGNNVAVVIGFDSVQGYVENKGSYFGAIIGRYGNRIGKGTFKLKNTTYQIPVNNGPNALHGGKRGFDDYVWDAFKENDSTLDLYLLSPDGDMGFPGNLKVKVTYALTHQGIKIEYTANTDKPTVLNLTNHAYWNLNGEDSGTILDHVLQIDAVSYTPVDTGLIPFGILMPVSGTPLDFIKPMPIGARINADNIQLKNGKGYDHNFVLGDGKPSDTLKHAATVWGDKSGIIMDVWTMEPGLQFYSGNFMKGAHAYRSALCLETQHFPDSPNKPAWPSTELDPGKTYHTVTEYRFTTQP
jgi:aldose 1-epimerase